MAHNGRFTQTVNDGWSDFDHSFILDGQKYSTTDIGMSSKQNLVTVALS